MKAKKINYKKRWETCLEKTDFTILDCLSASENFSASPFGTIHGKTDLRGVSHSYGSKEITENLFNHSYALIEIKNISVTNADFTTAEFLDIHFHNCKFKNCIFDDARFDDGTRFWDNCEFTDCSFSRTAISHCAFNSIELINCSFIETKWKTHNTFSSCSFKHCRFEGEIKNMTFSDAVFEHSKFTGTLYNVTFEGWSHVPFSYENNGVWLPVPHEKVHNKMLGADFSDAELILCNITQYCYLDKIIPPKSSNNIVFHIIEAFYQAGINLIKETWKEDAGKPDTALTFMSVFYKPDNRTPDGIAHKNDYAKRNGEAFSHQFFSVLQQASDMANVRITNKNAGLI